jgi:hypothetical protein
MSARRRWLRAGGGAVLLAATRPARTAPPADARPFAFALVGDTPYSDAGEDDFGALLRSTDADPLAFVLHVGDLKASREPCDDVRLERRRALLSRSAHPLLVLPGDNDWTDCGRAAAGRFDPLERLQAWRARFATTPGPLGRGPARVPITLERQPGWPENLRWQIGDTHFVGLHVVGSDNGLTGAPADRAAFEARRDANRTWLHDSLRQALDQRAGALAIAFHANPRFEQPPRPGFADWIVGLREVAAAFRHPILLLHGDTHRFRVDRPLADVRGDAIAHVTRVESFGWPFTASWVHVAHDPHEPARFRITVREVPRGA